MSRLPIAPLAALSVALSLGVASVALAAPTAGAWTGPYVGVAAGVAFDHAKFVLPGDMSDVLLKTDANKTEFTGAALIGFDHQINSVVLGLEGDFNAVNSTHRVTACNVTDGCWTSAHDSFTTHNMLKEGMGGRVRGRVGLVSGRSLFYAAAGYSVADTRLDLVGDCFNGGNPAVPLVFTYSRSKVISGYNLGVGVESAVGRHIVLRTEYIFDNYGGQLYKGDGSEWNDRLITVRNSTVRGAISYRF